MKLIELLNSIPEDYAVRTVSGLDSLPSNLPTFDPAYAKVIGTFDNRDVWGSREKRGCEVYGFREGQVVMAYLIIDENAIDPNVYQFKELWVNPNYRRKGLASGLILFLTQKVKIGLALSADELVSADAREIFIALGTSGKIKIQDETGDLSSYEKILKDRKKNDHVLLVKEDHHSKKLFGGRMKFDNGQYSIAESYSVGVMQEWSEFD